MSYSILDSKQQTQVQAFLGKGRAPPLNKSLSMSA
jgi:hypothetical protein